MTPVILRTRIFFFFFFTIGPDQCITEAEASTPLLWRDSVDANVYDMLSEMERKRQEVIYELIRTEKEYVRDLHLVVEVCAYFICLLTRNLIMGGKTQPELPKAPRYEEDPYDCPGQVPLLQH